MNCSRCFRLRSRASGLLAVSLAIFGLCGLASPPSPAPSPSPGRAALRAFVDAETGTLTISADGAAKALDAELQSSLSTSTAGLREVVYPHGGVGVNLQGRFQSASLARLDAEGNLVSTCVENAADAQAFLEGPAPVPPQPKWEVQ